mmetsp:Transcript_82470/g.229897  ORF Transcript_82470/g.229897 Transcript_82470/m.229897 type:complete len:757 (+) Transcript_82470:83-2353(+)
MPMATEPVSRGEAIELDLDRMSVERGLQLIEEERVRPILNYLKTGVFENKTNMTFMKAYSVVVHFGDQQQDASKLYAYYKKVISEYCEENVDDMKISSGDDLLRRLANLWEKHTILSFWMQRVFQYLDRFFTKNANEYPALFSTALRSFQVCVYDVVKSTVTKAMVEAINRDRDGHAADLETMRLLVEMLCVVNDPQPKIVKQKDAISERLIWHSSSKGAYKFDFEPALLSETADYYRAKVTGWLAAYTCPMFLQEVSDRLDHEERRLNLYLDRSSQDELLQVVQRELILKTAKQLVEMDSGCKTMFRNRRYDELTLMYKLFRREPTMLQHVTAVMKPYVEERCTAIVADQQKVDNPPVYVENILELKAELDDMVSRCFDNLSEFQKARNQGLETVLNKDTRCAKYLALFCDLQLRKKGKSDSEMAQLVSEVVSLFAHLTDKDIFLDFYKRQLSRRLLNRLTVSNDAEDVFISKLKVECGQQAIQKLVSMFTDMSLSDQLQDEYNKASHGGSPGGVSHEIRVLQTNAWPEKPDEASIVPCAEMRTCMQAFETFYNSKHSGRKLQWMFNMGYVELSANCFQRKHILVASAYQCLVLMLFNARKEISFREIVEATKVPPEDCKRQVLSMTVSKQKLLLGRGGAGKTIDDETKLEVNSQFTSEKVKVVVSLIKKEEKAAPEPAVAETPVERKHVIDAAIVRIMKSRRTLDHNSLLEDVFRQCTLFKPQPSQVKQQLEHLIEREFLKRDEEKRNVYIYLP